MVHNQHFSKCLLNKKKMKEQRKEEKKKGKRWDLKLKLNGINNTKCF